MKRLQSTLVDDVLLPYEFELRDAIEFAGLTGFIPIRFISDLITIAICKLLDIEVAPTDYVEQLQKLVRSIQQPIIDSVLIVKLLGQKYNLREIEEYAKKHQNFDIDDISRGFNYPFELKAIPDEVKELLDITEDNENEIEKLPEEVINILTITSGYGNFIKTSKTYKSESVKMENYGDIVKIPKHKYVYPLFNYHFSIKAYEYMTDQLVNINGDKLIIGYYIGSYISNYPIRSILKLLGSVVLTYGKDKKVIIYSFYGDRYKKTELSSTEDIINFFSQPAQLKIFSIDNTAALNAMISENRGEEIIFMPNIRRDCAIHPGNAGLCKVNIISFSGSKYNIKFSNICKQTGGTMITI